ncbi:replicative DNA helicase [Govanella unica]|uniref:Replicative DNA helicase n=1 Tax=Govanella unica TaxID=2975056 RepID=A0A9X3Z7N6_9PROT|nr:replicative DNA helicase [Govania unica]MDA5194341.1 replicative DNA helicase [Govania unica]
MSDNARPIVQTLTPDGPEEYRTLPHNLEAEQALLGAILVNNEAAGKVQDFLLADHYFEPVHGRIYEAALRLIDRGQLATPVTMKPFFERDPALADVGGAQYLARLAGAAVTILNAEDYGRLVYDLALRRELITIGEDMVITAYDSPVESPATTQIEVSEQKLFELAERGQKDGGFKTFSRSMTDAIQVIEAAYKRDGKLSGTTTGFRAINEKIGGLHPSDLIILAGRPAMGKTALATNIGFNAALAYARNMEEGIAPKDSEGAVVGFFSLEMSADQLATRILAERSRIPSENLRRGQLTKEQFRDLTQAAQDLERLPFYIDDTPQLTISALRTRARRLKRQHNLGLVIVDYLQLLRGSGTGGRAPENRVQEVSEITRGLKGLAKELSLPVIALSQLSRGVEQREDKRPQLSDLRESGSIEQDADMVTFVFREEYYHAMKEPALGTPEHAEWQAKGESLHGLAEFIIGKQRHGPTGTIRLFFERETTRFSDLAEDNYGPEPF